VKAYSIRNAPSELKDHELTRLGLGYGGQANSELIKKIHAESAKYPRKEKRKETLCALCEKLRGLSVTPFG